MDEKELIEKIKTNRIAIYGTGYVANVFYNFLVKKQLTDNLDFFITSDGGDKYNGYEVLPVTDNRIGKVFILIAVHESLKNEIIDALENGGCHDYIWINSELLYTLMLGKPIEKNACISLKNLWIRNRNNYAWAVRTLAIDNYFGKNTYGFEIYKSAMELFCNSKTAERRLEQFCFLIESWEKNGYDEFKPSMILEDCSFIDGVHRISLASYFNQEYIKCNIYSLVNNAKLIHDKKAILPKGLAQEWLDEKTVRILEETNQRIDRQYNLTD